METKVKNAVEAHEEIERLAKTNTVQDVRRVLEIKVGKVVRQGDIYIHRVKTTHKRGKPTPNHQLALGNTQGSRHVAGLEARCFEGTTTPEWCDSRTFLGPVVESDEPFTITHPEHAHVELPAGTYQITHQMDARTLERVRD